MTIREFLRSAFKENNEFGCLVIIFASILLIAAGLFILISLGLWSH